MDSYLKAEEFWNFGYNFSLNFDENVIMQISVDTANCAFQYCST